MTILPAIILITVAIPTVAKIFNLAKSDDAACVVNVTGQQWWWEYDYPVQNCGGIEITQPIVTSGEWSSLPVSTCGCGSPAATSSTLVLDPRLNGKRDAVPGLLQPLRMQADQPGIYTGQCTEFCASATPACARQWLRWTATRSHLGGQPGRGLHVTHRRPGAGR